MRCILNKLMRLNNISKDKKIRFIILIKKVQQFDRKQINKFEQKILVKIRVIARMRVLTKTKAKSHVFN